MIPPYKLRIAPKPILLYNRPTLERYCTIVCAIEKGIEFMFTLMTTTREKTMEPSPRKPMKLGSHIPPHFLVEKAQELLNNKKCKQFLRELKPLANAPQAHYEKLFLGVVDKFAEYVQKLPSTRVGQFRFHGGMLELGLGRAVKSLELYRKQVPITHYTPESMPPKLALWSYALFTASLCLGMGEMAATYWVSLCDNEGKNSQRWIPQQGPMTESGYSHYRYTFEAESWDSVAQRTTPLMAASILPKEGFDWLTSDKEVWDFWLALLQDDARGAGSFAKFVYPAQDILIENYAQFTQALTDAMIDAARGEQNPWTERSENPQTNQALTTETYNTANTVSTTTTTPSTFLDTAGKMSAENLGAAFLNWLSAAIERGDLTVNNPDSFILVTEKGAVVLDGAFKQFVEANPNIAKDTKVVYSALQQMNVDTGKVQTLGARSAFTQSSVFGNQRPLAPLSLDATFLGLAELRVLSQQALQYMVITPNTWPPLKAALAQSNTPTPSAGK